MTSGIMKNLQDNREVFSNNVSFSTFLTAYVGIYNGKPYLNDMFKFIESSDWENTNLIIVDNASTDGSWNEIISRSALLNMPYKLIRNPINLGGGGSFDLNKDLLHTEWVTFIHQDDIYLSKHLPTLREAALASDPKTILISTEMGSMDQDGDLIYATPRAIWMLRDKSPTSYFLANLRTHIVPWGSSIFRTKQYLSVDLAWHSTAFPDTEMLLKMCALGNFVNLPVQTMIYRESSISESHGLGNREKEIAAVAALARVFSSDEFKLLAKEIPLNRREEFMDAINSGLAIRLQDTDLTKLVELIAEESLLIAWNYDEPSLIKSVSAKYEDFGAERVTELFNRILGSQIVGEKPISDEELVSARGEFQSKLDKSPTKGIFLNYLLKNLPYNYRRFVLKILLKVKISLSKNHPNKFNW
jgi:glycosyltransferase involved in cell wall biosynthesis